MLIQYLIKQSRNPSGLVGRVITNIWSSYFKELSLWAIKQTTIPNNSRILEVGYGIDISKESYQTAKRMLLKSIDNDSVQLMVGNVENLPYQNHYFDLVFAIQTHIFWKDLKESFQEIYRVMSNHSILIIASEKEKIKYHMTDYGTSSELSQLLTSIGFSKIEERQNHKWVLYIVIKRH